jgi:NTE family protein
MEHVSYISVVSGGAFTGTYYALSLSNPNEFKFTEFKKTFLDVDNESEILSGIFFPYTPIFLAKLSARSYVAGNYYNQRLFGGKTFANLENTGPFLIINATDLVTGRRFTFTQEEFLCLGSSLENYPLGYAVAASAAFPVAFSPIKLVNYLGNPSLCFNNTDYIELSRQGNSRPASRNAPHQDPTQSSEIENLVLRQRYLDHLSTSHLYLSDGGISDNLGVQAFIELLPQLSPEITRGAIKGIVLISVNAATTPPNAFGGKSSSPGFLDVLSTATDLLLKRASGSSLTEVTSLLKEFDDYFRKERLKRPILCMSISFNDIEEDSLRLKLHSIPTRLSLPPDEVNTLITTGKFIVRKKANELNAIRKLIRDPDSFDDTPSLSCNLAF